MNAAQGTFAYRIARIHKTAKTDIRDSAVVFEAACLTCLGIAHEADQEIARLRDALREISEWPSGPTRAENPPEEDWQRIRASRMMARAHRALTEDAGA